MKADKTFLVLVILQDYSQRMKAEETLKESWPFGDEYRLEVKAASCVRDALTMVQEERPDAVLAEIRLPWLSKKDEIPSWYSKKWQMEVTDIERYALSALDHSKSIMLACLRLKIPYLKFFQQEGFKDPRVEFKARVFDLQLEHGEDGLLICDTIFLRRELLGVYAGLCADLQRMGLRDDLAENRFRRLQQRNPPQPPT